ncbi:MAG: response regulator [Cyanobacteria bacterium SZAS LIN-3]|nr:response regulator [Cyanobacteria bacterium SZAS LIN-3]
MIEDSPTDAILLRAKLQGVTEFSFHIEHVTSLAAGIEQSGQAGFDAVILDLSLPDSHGLATYARLRDVVPQSVPIVIVTGNEDRALLNDALKQGADNYLVKDTLDGNRIAVAILSSMTNRNQKLNTAQQRVLDQ